MYWPQAYGGAEREGARRCESVWVKEHRVAAGVLWSEAKVNKGRHGKASEMILD